MTIDKILTEINTRIEYLEKKKKGLNIREITHKEMEKIKDTYDNEIDKLAKMKYFYNK